MAKSFDPSDPVSPELNEAVGIYQAFMEEIKVRLGAIARTVEYLKANKTDPQAFLQAEFGFLQLRFVCDLVALSVLVAHKPYGLTDELMESWHARRALHDLSQINRMSFPRPAKILRSPQGAITITTDDADALKRGKLQDIYDRCGRILHRGALRHIFGKGKEYDIDALDRWARQIGHLLGHHLLMILDEGLVLVVNLTSGEGGTTSIAICQADGPAVFEPRAKE